MGDGMTRRVNRLLQVAVALTLLIGARDNARAEGTVLGVDGERVYVDLGARDGVGAGTRLTLLHIVVAKDPVTGEVLRDRFPLGELTVVKAGEHLCLAAVPEELQKRVREGDAIALATRPREFEDPWQVGVEESKQRAAEAHVDVEIDKAGKADERSERRRAEARVAAAMAVRSYWNDTLGKDPRSRIEIWQRYLKNYGDSAYAARVKLEISSLERQEQAERLALSSKRDPEERRAEMRIARLAALEATLDASGPLALHSPERVLPGNPVSLAFVVLRPRAVERAWLYYRHRGEKSYQRTVLEHDGDAYLRGAIPASVSVPPGIDYFVEVAAGDKKPVAAIGHQAEPRTIRVETPVEEKEPEIDDRSRVTLLVDYVDFDGGLQSGFDQYFQGEVDFMYRFYRPVYAVRVGFGSLDGMGGPKDVIDDDPADSCRDSDGVYACRRVAYHYAYTELELRYSSNLAFMLRPIFGTGSIDRRPGSIPGRCTTADADDPECKFIGGFGLRARVRFGQERGTNLSLGFGVTENVGTLFEATYTWSVIPHFPVLLSAQVTNQPVPEDYGVRLIADVGWRALDWVYPSLRISYQARDVDHAGLSGGVAANFDW